MRIVQKSHYLYLCNTKTLTKTIFMLNTLLLASLAISGVAGVTPDSVVNKDVSLNEVVVTDFKQNKRNLTSIAVSTINSQQLLNQQIVNLKELTAVMPNFYMPDYGSYANTPIFIRGIGAKDEGFCRGFLCRWCASF